MTYPLVMTDIAIENGHWNSGCSHQTWWFSIGYVTVYQRVFESDGRGSCLCTRRTDWQIRTLMTWWAEKKTQSIGVATDRGLRSAELSSAGGREVEELPALFQGVSILGPLDVRFFETRSWHPVCWWLVLNNKKWQLNQQHCGPPKKSWRRSGHSQFFWTETHVDFTFGHEEYHEKYGWNMVKQSYITHLWWMVEKTCFIPVDTTYLWFLLLFYPHWRVGVYAAQPGDSSPPSWSFGGCL